MYQLYLDKLSGRPFVADSNRVYITLALLNNKISEKGELSANEYYKMLELEPLYPSITYMVLKGVMFQFSPTRIQGVSAIAIDIERVSFIFDEDEREEVEFV